MLLVNGLGADHTAWGLQIAALEKHHRVVVFDNPGVGRTEGPRGPYTTELFADVAAALLAHLEHRAGPRRRRIDGRLHRPADRAPSPAARALALAPLHVGAPGQLPDRSDPQLAGLRAVGAPDRPLPPDLAVRLHGLVAQRPGRRDGRPRAPGARQSNPAESRGVLRPGRGVPDARRARPPRRDRGANATSPSATATCSRRLTTPT